MAAPSDEGADLRSQVREAVSAPVTPPRCEGTTSYSDYSMPPHANMPPDLQRILTDSHDEEMIRAIVHLDQQVDFDRVFTGVGDNGGVRARLVSKLRATADLTQAPLLSYLSEQRDTGHVSSYESLWITNAIAVRAHPSVVRALAAHPSVAVVRLDQRRRWISDETMRLASHAGTPRLMTEEARTDDAQREGPVEWNVSRIRADEVWHTLQVSGTGAVVAGLDTGVDWLHPALSRSYRGYNPHGPSDHASSWFDATGGGAVYPVDGHGHGSHTLGIIVGGGGIGVAPGAQWIAAKVLDNEGYGYDSWIHAGFQWVLAPRDDPSLAPDVVNCSWGSDNAHLTIFQDDLRALRAAGILAVFANGNGGPDSGSVSSPASLPEAFAVGAIDAYDEVTSFSARGPTPWGGIRPHVVAPGVHVYSSTPGGAYELKLGTSMAAPHVSGVAAMLRAVSPTVTITRAFHLITSTAVAIGAQVPNNDTGWGRVDAFAAVAALARPGFITGTVRSTSDPESGTVHPIAGATVVATPHGDGSGGRDVAADDGTYQLALAPGIYDLTASAFGYQASTQWRIPVVTETTTVRNFALAPNLTGSLHVRVRDASSGRPVTATVAVLGTPYDAVTHTHTFHLPAGTYTVRAQRLSYRVVTATATVTTGETVAADLALPRSPSILVVDSGRWYYESQIAYFRQALDGLSYAYEELPIRDLRRDIPSASDLIPYDIVIWSAPRDAPGYIGAGEAVSGYLQEGGRLLLTGQDVGYWDGGGASYGYSPYYWNDLKVRFAADDAPTRVLAGEDGDIFSGEVITIAGPGGADNQDYPDVIAIGDTDAAVPVLRYQSDGCGGARVGTCLDYRAVYLSFGFEAINERDAGRSVMKDSLDWLVAPPPGAGLEVEPRSQLGIGTPGSQVTHTVRVRHVGQAGDPDQVDLRLHGASWPTRLSDPSLTLSPCTSTTVVISVTIPATATWDLRDAVSLTAHSLLSPTASVSARLETKTPAPILLVDDDRWYDQQPVYVEAMEDVRLTYDVWETSTDEGRHGRGPTTETLLRYPVVVWWTGYDWYAPVTRDEQASLGAYLDGGGRLMLSSQDFLYYHYDERFARDHLGVLTYTEDITPTHVEGVPEHPVGAGLGFWPLDYPSGYRNWSDGVVPALDVGVGFRDQGQRGTALTRRGEKDATLFLSFPFEALPSEARSMVMRRAVGWLSWLGRSTFEAEPRSVNAGDTVTYTLALRNDGAEVVTASLSNTLPAGLQPGSRAWADAGIHDPEEDQLTWQGTIRPGQVVTFSYSAVVMTDTGAGGAIVNTAHIRLEDHEIGFDRSARVRVAAPDLSRSTFRCLPSIVPPGRVCTCALTLRNTGAGDADLATARVYPPGDFELDEDSSSASGGTAQWVGDSFGWSGPLMASSTATLTFQLELSPDPARRTLYGVALLEDGTGGSWERPTWLLVRPWSAYLPMIGRLD